MWDCPEKSILSADAHTKYGDDEDDDDNDKDEGDEWWWESPTAIHEVNTPGSGFEKRTGILGRKRGRVARSRVALGVHGNITSSKISTISRSNGVMIRRWNDETGGAPRSVRFDGISVLA